MERQRVVDFLRANWGKLSLILVLLLTIFLNVKPGFLILGNDTFAPELNPSLTIERSLLSPAWRTYRVLGIPSDTEQSDLFRAVVFWLLEKAVPPWAVSQGYLFFTFFIASLAMGGITAYFAKRVFSYQEREKSFLMGGLFYTCSLLTAWIYFSPVQLFVAAYTFLPLTLWLLTRFFEKPTVRNVLLLFLSSLFLSTAALTATMFAVCALLIIAFLSVLAFARVGVQRKRDILATAFFALFVILGTQLYWALPFLTYVETNRKALLSSSINREITATTIEAEAKHNTVLNVPRFYASWMDTKEKEKGYTFPYRDWYKKSAFATWLSMIPIILGTVGSFYLLKRRYWQLYIIPATVLLGWFLIKGANPPDTFPTIAQVFRWQSSKLWPLLAVNIPILATLGALWLGRNSRFILIAIVAGLLAFVYPYFRGDLVGKNMFVKLPQEYADLKEYLKKTDRFSRIYLAPEANTLYFRNYAWGFWGSVVLNYLLPNPIVEKALIIGSQESEQAFTVLLNAYYSENPKMFSSALRLYDIPLVLSDKNASTGEGYAYNWEVHARIVESNPDFEKVWESKNLTLYRLRDYETISKRSVESVYPKSDFAKLNTILVEQGSSVPYYVEDNSAGTLYPFALAFDDVTVGNDEIIGKATYTQPDAIYTLHIDKTLIEHSPTKMVYSLETQELSLAPALPRLSVNETQLTHRLPSKRYKLTSIPSFITIDDDVVSKGEGGTVTSSSPYWQGEMPLRAWQGRFIQEGTFFCNNSENLRDIEVSQGTRTKCGSKPLFVEKDTVVELEMRLKSNAQVHALLCVESSQRQACLNKNVSAFIKGTKLVRLVIPRVLLSGDTLKVYLDFQLQGKDRATVSIEQFVLRLYETYEVPHLIDETGTGEEQELLVPLKTNDTIALAVPVLTGSNTLPIRSDGPFIPETSITPFATDPSSYGDVSITPEGLHITNRESTVSVFPKVLFLEPSGGIGLVAVSGSHRQGIPVEVSFRDITKPYKLWARRHHYKRQTRYFDLFLLPDAVRSYYLETLVTGFGPRASDNTIAALIFQVIPKEWATLRLVPNTSPLPLTELEPSFYLDASLYHGTNTGEAKRLVAIPTATSPNWQLVGAGSGGQPVVVNGWKQGWLVRGDSALQVFFAPTLLAYAGFAPILLTSGLLVGFAAEKVLRAARVRLRARAASSKPVAQSETLQTATP